MNVNKKMIKVAILGASNNPQRYSYQANKLLKSHGYQVFLVNPFHNEIDGELCLSSINQLPDDIHTLTVYVNPNSTFEMIDLLENFNPKRIILNPGASSQELSRELTNRNITFIEACTLVMLNTGQFE
ncbi:MAG: CoA-binding protein [Planctomycetota bacterium]|nr:MAG: CoA-binding protein [Planctomycetota bacterium]